MADAGGIPTVTESGDRAITDRVDGGVPSEHHSPDPGGPRSLSVDSARRSTPVRVHSERPTAGSTAHGSTAHGLGKLAESSSAPARLWTDLHPGADGGLANSMLQPFIVRVAGTLLGQLPDLSAELYERIVATDPFYAAAIPAFEGEVRQAISDNLSQFLRGLAGLEPLDFELPRRLARQRASEGVPLASLLHAYRLAAQLVWEHHVAAGHAWGHQEFDLGQILDGSAIVWNLTGTYSGLISQAYEETVADRARQSERERTLLLDTLFEGRTVDTWQVADAARLLDLPERGTLAVVVAENTGLGRGSMPGIDGVLRMAGFRSVWRFHNERQIGVVVVPDDASGATRLAEVLGARATARIGISPIYGELRRTAESVALADVAVNCLPPGSVGVAAFDDYPVRSLVARSPDLAARLAERVLGPVLALDKEERATLLETLSAWLDEDGSVQRAGERLFCHRNTVRNRLLRVAQLTGRSLDSPCTLTEICLAIEALAIGRAAH